MSWRGLSDGGISVGMSSTDITGDALLALVRCPRPEDYTPREQASPSSLQQWAACQRSWGERYLHGRRETSLTWAEAELIPEPPKAPRGASAIEKATQEALRKAYNKLRRPALGTEVHAVLGAYMVQNTPGAWHPPMAWVEIDWESTAGRIARPAADVLPDPRGLVGVYTELAAEVEAPAGWAPKELTRLEECPHCGEEGESDWQETDLTCPACGTEWEAVRKAWPRMPGFYDLITVERFNPPPMPYVDPPGLGLMPAVGVYLGRYRLWDYKSTSSFDWAKTEEELREDPQVLLYGLHAMQTFGLDSIECNWVYLLTDPEKQPKSYVVTVVITRAEAEAAVLEMAETAAAVCSTVRLYTAGKLKVVDLDQNVSACAGYGGCIYHKDKGGPCEARVSPGQALRQRSELDAKIKARKSARKENEKAMALSFAEKKAQRDAEKAAAAKAGGDAPASVEQGEGGGETAADANGPGGAEASAAASAATAKARENKPKATRASGEQDSITVIVNAHEFTVPAGSPVGKQLSKASKALAAAAAAFAGE